MSYQQYGAPGGPPPGQYGQPQGQYGPPQGQYGPPQGQYGPPPGQYGQPQGQYGQYPPQSNYGAPPQGYPPPQQQQQQGYGAPPPVPPHPNTYGAPPQQNYNMPPAQTQPTPPSIGYAIGQTANVDTRADADALERSMKGFGTNDKDLIRILVNIPDPLIMENLKHTYAQVIRKDLIKRVKGETSGYYEEGLVALINGPLRQDVECVRAAVEGPGTNEDMLDDILLGRSNADLHAIKQLYQTTYRTRLEDDVRNDLSMKTRQMYDMVLAARRQEDSAPVYPQAVAGAADALHRAMHGLDKDQITVCQILSSHSDGQIRAIAHDFRQRYARPLADVVRTSFQGHMEHALLRMLACGEDRAMADAQSLEDAMAGVGTKDRLLINRLVRLHWNRQHMQQVRGAYRHRFKQELTDRIVKETSGNYERLAVALVQN